MYAPAVTGRSASVTLVRARRDEPALVGEDDGLDAVAQAELDQQPRRAARPPRPLARGGPGDG